MGTWLLDAPTQVPPSIPPEFFVGPPVSWPLALMTVGPSPFQLPSLPGTLLPNILCGNQACWPHTVLLATAKFLLLCSRCSTSRGTFMKEKAATSFLLCGQNPLSWVLCTLQQR